MNLERQFKNISLTRFLEEICRNKFFWTIKRLTGNDTGATSSHQVGPYFARKFFASAIPEICTVEKKNPDAKIKEFYFPGDDYHGQNLRAVFYNNKFAFETAPGTRGEYRITGWGGKKTPVLCDENIGSIFIFALKKSSDGYYALCWVSANQNQESIIEEWLDTEVEPGSFYFSHRTEIKSFDELKYDLPEAWKTEFPKGNEIFDKVIELLPFKKWTSSVDALLLKRRKLEFEIFEIIENHHVFPRLKTGFDSVNEFVSYSNSVANRRKSRTGRSLELNLENIFREEGLYFQTQKTTELKKKPDFLFPSQKAYKSDVFPLKDLHMVAAKTCCKDRWRQIVNEAGRIDRKHLFTLQEGVSIDQFKEMTSSNICLVVPKQNLNKFPIDAKKKILSLEKFVSFIRDSQSSIPDLDKWTV